MAWFARLLNTAIALRTIEVTRIRSALSINPILLGARAEWAPESRTTVD